MWFSVFLALSGLAYAISQPSCPQLDISQCAKPEELAKLRIFPESEDAMDEYCVLMTAIPKCFKDYFERCPDSSTFDLRSLFEENLKQVEKMCTKGSPTRQIIIQNAKCLNQNYMNIMIECSNIPMEKLRKMNYCEIIEEANKCSYGKVKSICGDDIASYLKEMTDVTLPYLKKDCDQIGAADVSNFLMAPIPSNVIIG